MKLLVLGMMLLSFGVSAGNAEALMSYKTTSKSSIDDILYPARSGCCSWHGGVAYCSTITGKYICQDGHRSSCSCF